MSELLTAPIDSISIEVLGAAEGGARLRASFCLRGAECLSLDDLEVGVGDSYTIRFNTQVDLPLLKMT